MTTTPRVPEPVPISAFALFQSCRQRFKYHHQEHLSPVEKARYLRFGAAAQVCIKAWLRSHAIDQVLAIVNDAFPNREHDADDRADWHYLTAMMRAYAVQFTHEDFEVLALDQRFDSALVNPVSNRSSRSFRVASAIPAVVRQGDDVLVMKHRTASALPHDIGDRLAADLSLQAGAYFAREALGHPVTGILCIVLVKPRLVQATGETEEEYQARCADLIAASKAGKTTAKRRLPESDEAFQARLAEWFAAEPRFARIRIPFEAATITAVRTQMWGVGKEILLARRQNLWHRSYHACFGFGVCPFRPICSASDPAAVIASQFRVERVDQGGPTDDAENDDPTASF